MSSHTVSFAAARLINSWTHIFLLRADGSLTILLQDSVGGLQVVTKSGGWANVPYIEGGFVINIGDLVRTVVTRIKATVYP